MGGNSACHISGICVWISKTVCIRADGVVLLREGVLRGPSGGERVVHPRPEVEERDGGGEEGLGLLAGEVPAVLAVAGSVVVAEPVEATLCDSE